ncbi:unnamed protein product [Parnassius mnemosyne]|uniref:Secreted protein n=1 Tax=Parnassius mnemosyne TaxID=213953 RepID=A0AAV1KDJ5_9NEOP
MRCFSSLVFTVVGRRASVACPHCASIRSAQRTLLPPDLPAPSSPSSLTPERWPLSRAARSVTCVARPQSQSGRVARHPLRTTRYIMTVT